MTGIKRAWRRGYYDSFTFLLLHWLRKLLLDEGQWKGTSRNDFARSADKDISERSEPLLPKDALEVGVCGCKDTCGRALP